MFLPERKLPKKVIDLHELHDTTIDLNVCSHTSTLLLDTKPHTSIFLLSRDMLCYDDMYDDTYDVCTASIDDSPISYSNRYSSGYILLDT